MPQKSQEPPKARRYNTRGNTPAEVGTLYPGRRADKVVRALTIDREADLILRRNCGDGKKMGAFMSRLLYEFQTREDERQQIARKLLGG